MALKITPLSSALGAEVTEIDLRKPLDEASIKAIRDAFDQYIVLCIREQTSVRGRPASRRRLFRQGGGAAQACGRA